jgi:predicted ATPase/DNA-binding XRE family transcriptional regulator
MEVSFAVLLRRHRLAAHLTQEALAEAAGLSADAISALERGWRRWPQRQTVERLAGALTLSPADRAALLAAARRPASPRRRERSAPALLPFAPLTELVGRQRELEQVRGLFATDGVRLVTLTGTPGVGKTRLSQAAALELAGGFPDGVFFVPLAPLADPELVVSAIRQALGFREDGGSPEALASHLGSRRVLLLLDNFEHVLAASPLLPELLSRCPELRLLVTSRAALRLRGERQVAVPPLPLPGSEEKAAPELVRQAPAVALFLQRVEQACPGFELTAGNAPAVAEICRRLDGLPLALELAAPWIRLLSPGDLLARLEGRRLEMLVHGARDLPERQRTLRETLRWSHELLGEEERALFRRLAVFAGGAPIEAIEPVCGTASGLSALAGLVDKSLVQRQELEGESRVGMLESVREYAGELLAACGEAEGTARAHAEWYLGLARASGELGRSDQSAWMARFERELDNLRAALRWARHGDPQVGLELAGRIWRFWRLHGHVPEGLVWLNELLGAGGEVSPAVRARGLNAAGNLGEAISDYAGARARFEEALSLYRALGDRHGVSFVLNNLGNVAFWQGDLPRSLELFEEALALRRTVGDDYQLSICLSNLALPLTHMGSTGRAAASMEESLAIRRRLGDVHGITTCLLNLADLARVTGELERASSLLLECLDLCRQTQDQAVVIVALNTLGQLAWAQGDAAAAGAHYRESLDLSIRTTDPRSTARCLEGLAAVASMREDKRGAAILYGAAEALRERISSPLLPNYRAEQDRLLTQVREALGEVAYSAAWSLGRSLPPEQALAATALA